MLICLIRHAIAMDRSEWNDLGKLDCTRPLTPKGKLKFAKGAQGLKKLIPSFDHIYSSKFLRAKQTTALLKYQFPHAKYYEDGSLNPNGDFFKLWEDLKSLDSLNIAIVGHEPDLSSLARTILESQIAFSLNKGGVIILERGLLHGHYSPKSLRLL